MAMGESGGIWKVDGWDGLLWDYGPMTAINFYPGQVAVPIAATKMPFT